MRLYLSLIIGLPLWVLALYGALQIRLLDIGGTHAICGRWGCGPPLPALLAWHAFLLALLTPPTVAASIYFTPSQKLWLGRLLMLIGAGAVAGLAVWQAFVWLPIIPEPTVKLFLQRVMFTVATTTDFPIAPVLLAGLALWTSPSFNDCPTAAPTRPEQSIEE